MKMLKEKKVLITGSANGIGKTMTETFLSEGCKVWAIDKDEVGLEKLYRAHNLIVTSKVDISSEIDIMGLIKNIKTGWGSIDILINNAGISRFCELEKCETSDFDEIIAVNLRAPFILAREFTRMHTRGNYGRIINIASTRYIMSEPGGEAYGASKGGLVSLTHSLANSLAGSGVTVNCIAPGWINTGNSIDLSAADHSQHPSGRVGNALDVALIALFLAQPHNDFINGEEIRVDGGMTRKMIYI